MQNEGRKIMHLPELQVSCTCVRVPVVRSHSVSIAVADAERRPISVEEARAADRGRPGLPSGGRPWRSMSIPCRWIPAIRIWCSWAASATT